MRAYRWSAAWGVPVLLTIWLVGCQLFTPKVKGMPLTAEAGQLFCQIETDTGPTVLGVVTTATAAATSATPTIATVLVLAEGATKTDVDNACKQAALAEGAIAGVPTNPPTANVGTVTIPATAVPTIPTKPIS